LVVSGFILMHRAALDHPLFQGDSARLGAWLWLVGNACWKPTRIKIKGSIIQLERGEMSFSVRFLAEAWGWSKSRVDRFIADLRAENMIETRSKIGTAHGHKAGQGQSIISICNYSKYQDMIDGQRDNAGTTRGTRAGQARDKEEQGNKGTIEEEPSGSSSPLTPKHTRMADWPEIPEWVPVDPWNAFIAMRKRSKGGLPTARAIELILGKLERWRTTGQDPGAVLDQSTENQWTRILELKDQQDARSNHNAPRDNRDGLQRWADEKLGIGAA
jgi:hypothetical protein